MRRPLVVISAVYCGGIIAARFAYPLSRDQILAAAVVTLLFAVITALFRSPSILPGSWVLYFLPLFFLVGLLNYSVTVQRVQGNLAQFDGQRVILEGVVAAEPILYAHRGLYLLEAGSITLEGGEGQEKISVQGRVRLVVEYRQEAAEEAFLFGDLLRVRGKLTHPTGPRNPGGFDYNKFLLSQGAGAQLYVKQAQAQVLPYGPLPGASGSLMKTVYSLKSRTQDRFQHALPPPQAALLGGILFGRTSGLPPWVEENFRASGVSHLLAVSGLHVGLVALLAVKLLSLLGIRGEGALLWGLPLVAVFTLFTGFRPAVLRAFFMLAYLALTQVFGRDRDFPSALALAALATLMINPLYLFMPGFQLSYAGISFIVYLYQDFKGLFPFLPPFFQGIAAASMAAQLGVAPLTAYYFQQVSLVALLTNLILVAAVTPVLGAGLTGAVLGALWPQAGGLVLKLLSPLLAFFLVVTEAFSTLPLAVLEINHVSAYWIPLYYGAVLAYVNGRSVKRYLASLKPSLVCGVVTAALLLLLLAFGPAGAPGGSRLLEVTFLDVGQGSSVFIQTPSGSTVLVDAGGALFPNSRDPGEDVLVPFLRHKGIKGVDLLVISHPHLDHYGGAFALMAQAPPRALAVGTLAGEERYLELLRQAEEGGVEIHLLSAGDRLHLDPEVEILVLHPMTSPAGIQSSAGENDNSLVIKTVYGRVSFLLTGDIEEEVERLLLNNPYPLRSTFLQVPHHGSGTSSSSAFLQAVGPEVAVIPVGPNPFGHPSPKVLERLYRKGVDVYRTDGHGAVTVTTDGTRYTLNTMLGASSAAGP